jgi:lipopolysaccharide assembly outer membrane protein LptD (OstA)
MNNRLVIFALLLLGASSAQAQFGSFGDVPIELTAEGETRFVGGVAIAENNVIIHYGATSIYADYVQYNPDTRDVLAIGNVQIYRDGRLIEGDRALYNLETKLLRTADFRSGMMPFFAKAETVNSLKTGPGYEAKDVSVTTSDSSKPDYYFKAGTAHIHPNDYITMSNVKLYVGQTPVFWFPYIYQSLKEEVGYSFTPGYSSDWGAFLLNRYGIPITDHIHGMIDVDLRSRRGVAVGFETKSKFGPEDKSWARFRSYYVDDQNPTINPTAQPIAPVTASRYRLSFQSRTYLTDDIYANADINKLSDYRFLRDFYPSEYSTNPQPDNMVSVTKWDEGYTITGIARAQVNNFFDTTERLPEAALDITRQPISNLLGENSPIFYEGETSASRLNRAFGSLSTTDAIHPVATSSLLNDYNASRLDTYHQFSLPQTYGGWLSVMPYVGVRATYYSAGADSTLATLNQTATGLELRQDVQSLVQTKTGNTLFRGVVNAGVESSFKFSREWEDIQSSALGIDGLRHVVTPYTNLSFVKTSEGPDNILQFDRLTPSTELPSLNFPQFTSVDSITDWSILRLGVRNTLQTRRDDSTVDLIGLDTFFNANINAPDYPGLASEGTLSNLNNKLTFTPLSWVILVVNSQIPLTSEGFTQLSTSVHFLVNQDLSFTVGHEYLSNNPYFYDCNNLRFGAYYRLNDNWAVSFTDQYEFTDSTLQQQEYEIHRDLSSWVASLGFTQQNNISSKGEIVSNIGVILTFTLKDLPSLRLPVSVHPSTSGGDGL